MHFGRDSAPLLHNFAIVVSDTLQILFHNVIPALLSRADLCDEQFVFLLRVCKRLLFKDHFVVSRDTVQILLDELHTAFFGRRDLLLELDEFLIAVGASALALKLHDLLVVVDDALVVPFEELRSAVVSGGHLGVLYDGLLPFSCGPSLTYDFLTAHPNFGWVPECGNLEAFGFGLFKFLVDLLKSHVWPGSDETTLESGGRGFDLRLLKLDLKFDGRCS